MVFPFGSHVNLGSSFYRNDFHECSNVLSRKDNPFPSQKFQLLFRFKISKFFSVRGYAARFPKARILKLSAWPGFQQGVQHCHFRVSIRHESIRPAWGTKICVAPGLLLVLYDLRGLYGTFAINRVFSKVWFHRVSNPNRHTFRINAVVIFSDYLLFASFLWG